MSKELFYQLATLRLGNHLANQQMTEEKTGHFFINETKHRTLEQGLAVIFGDKIQSVVHTQLQHEYERRYKELLRERMGSSVYTATARVLHLTPQAGVFPITTNKEHMPFLPGFLQMIASNYWNTKEGNVESANRLFKKGYYLEVARVYFNTELIVLDHAVQLTQQPKLLQQFQEKYDYDIQMTLLTPYERATEVGDIILLDGNKKFLRKYYVVVEKDEGGTGFVAFDEIKLDPND